jgi:hypothetical protein
MPKIGRMKEVIRTRAFFLSLEKKGNRIRRMTEITTRGKCTNQSWRMP